MCLRSFQVGERKKYSSRNFQVLKMCFIKYSINLTTSCYVCWFKEYYVLDIMGENANAFLNMYTSRRMHQNGVMHDISATWIIHQKGVSAEYKELPKFPSLGSIIPSDIRSVIFMEIELLVAWILISPKRQI